MPSGRQYPHQWGWDAAYIAIGWSRIDPARAAAELESLLRGQWADGRVPHIVFHPDVPDDAYFPGPAFWDSDVDGVATSGLTQPPLHARAALEVARRSDDGRAFLRRVFGRLVDQHAYLAERRDAGGGGLAAIVHPWESGLDNSPAWDAPLAAVELPPGGVAPYERQDRRHVDASERPDDAAYDRFVHLARAYRDAGYADDGRSEFLIEDPLFNAIWLWSTHALAEIADADRRGPGPASRGRGAHPRGLDGAALGRRALPPARPANRPADRGPHGALAGAAAGPGPLAPAVARAVAAELASAHFQGPSGLGVASFDILAPAFEPRRYWRGPIWANLNWLLGRGLRQQGFVAQAEALEQTTLDLVSSAGMREYYDPITGDGLGADDFSWTAAAVLDILGAR